MSCEVQINTIDLLQKKNIIDDFSRDGRNRILKIIDFEKLNDKYTQLAKIKYPNLSILDGQLLFTIDEIEATDYSRLKYVRDVKYKTAWAVPNKELFDKIQIEFDKSRDPGPKEGEQLSLFMRTDASKPKTRLASTIYEIYPDITEKEIRTIYDNYVNLMGRAREGKQLPFDTFLSLMKTYQVYNYKDTYIFGQWDPKNAVFVTRVNSSPTSKELLAEAIPNLVSKGLDFISFVPKDVADKYARSGYTLSSTGFD